MSFTPTVTITLEEYDRLRKSKELNSKALLAKQGAEIMEEFLKAKNDGFRGNTNDHYAIMSRYISKVLYKG